MGMTIDEAISWLNTDDYESKGFEIATSVAIDTMRSYQMMQADYNARLKADMVAMLTEIQLEIEKYQKIHDSYCDHHIKGDVWEHHTREHYDSSSGKAIACDYCLKTIQQKINSLKESNNDKS